MNFLIYFLAGSGTAYWLGLLWRVIKKKKNG